MKQTIEEYAKDWAVSNADELLECVEVDELLEELSSTMRSTNRRQVQSPPTQSPATASW